MERSRKSSREMFPVIEAYLESGLTQKAFCAERDLAPAVFASWLAKYRRDHAGDAGVFVEITPNRPPADAAHMEINLTSTRYGSLLTFRLITKARGSASRPEMRKSGPVRRKDGARLIPAPHGEMIDRLAHPAPAPELCHVRPGKAIRAVYLRTPFLGTFWARKKYRSHQRAADAL